MVKSSDALERLSELESTTGVWTMKVILHIDRQHVTVLDTATHKVAILVTVFHIFSVILYIYLCRCYFKSKNRG